VIKVTDNGKGMCREEQEELFAKPPASGTGPGAGSFRKVGFSNVRERIALIYGAPYGVEITSFPGAFTCVELTLPFKEELLCTT
jgi:two-component system sensor histidine kinase YesM